MVCRVRLPGGGMELGSVIKIPWFLGRLPFV